MRRQRGDGLERARVEALFPGIQSVTSSVYLSRPNPFSVSWEEMVTLTQLVRFLMPKSIFEFGTFDGRTTLHLALNAPENAHVFTLDVVDGRFDFGVNTPYFNPITIGECFLDKPEAARITRLTGDSEKFDFGRYKQAIDFVFVDADHSYEAVLRDSRRALELVRPGGVVLWHDYLTIDGVTRALIQLGAGRALRSLEGTSLVVWRSCAEWPYSSSCTR